MYFTKRLNTLIARSFHWFQEHIAFLYPEVAPTVIWYNIMNCVRVKIEFYKNEIFFTLEGFLKNGPQRVQKGQIKGTNGLK